MTQSQLIDVETEEQLEAQLKAAGNEGLAVVHFWAEWCEPCKQMDEVLKVLGEDKKQLTLLRVEAEKDELEDVTEKYGVSMVPHFIFVRGGKVVDVLEGADPKGLDQKISKLMQSLPAAVEKKEEDEEVDPEAEKKELVARLEKLINADAVVLFMKGNPGEPRCGFSKKAVALLNQIEAKFGHFDILSDQAVRQGLKEYSDWPTYPQLYVKGELMGGIDIMQEMFESGELKTTMDEAAASDASDIKTRLTNLINQAKVMLFMKGNREEPRCGFSAKVVKALDGTGISYETFDILRDQTVRQELKTFSDWPTYPQLYVKGELIGGCDIILEMSESGELIAELT